jgi:hypothetical protein
MARLLLQGRINEVSQRIKTMRGTANDPYDNFDFLLNAFRDMDPVFFILAGDPGPYDRNLSTKNKAFANLLQELASQAEIGIHPSYGAGIDLSRIMKEKSRLGTAAGKEITKSRQHFIRISMPETYEALIKAGIKDDYSMGYASTIGFRAGIASSYNFYNLSKEEENNLRIHPFAFMDTTLSDYMGLSPEEYLKAIIPIIEEVKEVNGSLIGIWHNYALADDQEKHLAFNTILKSAKGA